MNHKEFDDALKEALEVFPGITLKKKQELCLKTSDQEEGRPRCPFNWVWNEHIYQLLPKVLSSHWFQKTGEINEVNENHCRELIQKQQTKRLCGSDTRRHGRDGG